MENEVIFPDENTTPSFSEKKTRWECLDHLQICLRV